MRPSKGYIDVPVTEKIRVGYRIWFAGEKRPYTVMATSKNLVACVKPFSLMKTYIYSIVDTIAKVRGTDGFVLTLPWHDQQHCIDSLQTMKRQGNTVSFRNRVPLAIVRLAKPTPETAKKPLPCFPST